MIWVSYVAGNLLNMSAGEKWSDKELSSFTKKKYFKQLP